MKGTETPYSSKEIVARLEIGDSTLRKWCLALEEQNYNFIRTDQNKRMFTEKDAYVLNQFKHLVKDKNMSINNAAAIVAVKYVNEVFSSETEVEQILQEVPVPVFPHETLEELKAEIEQVKDLNRMLLARMDEQQKYIEERLNGIESKQTEQHIATQETNQLLLATQEQEEQKKSIKGLIKWFMKK